MERYLWPVTFKNFMTEVVNLALENYFHSGPFKAEVKTSNTSKE